MTGGDPRLGQTPGKPATLYLPHIATTRNVTAFLPRRGGGLTPLACFSPCGRRCRYGNGSGLGCDGARQSPLQSLLLGVVEGGAQHRAADTLKTRQHLVGGHFADQQEQRRVARLQALRNILHELVVDADIRQGAAERAGGCADRRAGERHQKDQTDQGAPKRPRYRTGRRRMEQLVELDTAVRLLDGDDSVAEFDQVVLLHVEKLAADFFRLRFGRKGDDHEVGHSNAPFSLFADIPRMPGGCEVMIPRSGILGKVGRLTGAAEGSFSVPRYHWFESISLQRRVNKLSVPLEMMLVEGSIRRARTDWPSGGIARRNAHLHYFTYDSPPATRRTRRFRRCRDVYQPTNGSGGKPAASLSSPSRFTSAAVKANQAPQAPSATAWRHLRKDSLPTQQALGGGIETVADQIETDARDVLRDKLDRRHGFCKISLQRDVEVR